MKLSQYVPYPLHRSTCRRCCRKSPPLSRITAGIQLRAQPSSRNSGIVGSSTMNQLKPVGDGVDSVHLVDPVATSATAAAAPCTVVTTQAQTERLGYACERLLKCAAVLQDSYILPLDSPPAPKNQQHLRSSIEVNHAPFWTPLLPLTYQVLCVCMCPRVDTGFALTAAIHRMFPAIGRPVNCGVHHAASRNSNTEAERLPLSFALLVGAQGGQRHPQC